MAAAVVTSAQAQTSREEARKVVLGGGSKGTSTGTSKDTRKESPREVVLGGGSSTSTESGRQAEIEQVNREYDAKIASIRNNPTLTQEEKDRAIARLERDRARKIREIRNEGRDNDDDDYNDNKKNKKNKKTKSNNGKHLGWEKGVGNPHKNGGTPGKASKGKGKNKG